MEITEAITTGDSPAAQQWREQIKAAGSKDAAIRMGQERMMKLMSLTMFNLVLAGQQGRPGQLILSSGWVRLLGP
ncbi:MAG: hypothetical protein GY773_05215 [Actinomycetia bacterium]|nr:hypothetical protein [Actinomycetes bacterium]